MIILHKKNILTFLSCMIISILVFGFVKNERINETVPTVALPVSNKVIILDAGHGKPDERCTK